MLLAADRADGQAADFAEPVPHAPRKAAEPKLAVSQYSPSRYGEQRKPNWPAIIITVLIHVVLVAAAVQARYEGVHHRQERLTVVNLTPSPPPPSPPKTTPPPKSTPQVPVAAIAVPRPTPAIEVEVVKTPQPSPTIAAIVPAPPAPPAVASPVQARDLGTRMISGDPPRYPTESRRLREQGTVVLALILDLDGRVDSISVAHSSGYSRLDKAALRAVRKWRWSPTMQDGVPVKVKGQVEIPFVLQV